MPPAQAMRLAGTSSWRGASMVAVRFARLEGNDGTASASSLGSAGCRRFGNHRRSRQALRRPGRQAIVFKWYERRTPFWHLRILHGQRNGCGQGLVPCRATQGSCEMTGPTFTPPTRATGHCRHYSYQHGHLMAGTGPTCALGVDLSAPGASSCCWPEAKGSCSSRQEYTEDERRTWQAWASASLRRLELAISALPAPLPPAARGSISCPNCGGALHYARWHRGAMVSCEREGCCGARFSIESGADWPSPKKEGAA